MRPLIIRRRRSAPADPAPSRWAYRMQRLWLTPMFRGFVRFSIPAIVVGGLASWQLSDPARVDAIKSGLRDLRYAIEHRPEFMVRLMRIETATEEVANDIREVVPIDFPVSSFDLELDRLKAEIETLDSVARADLVIRSGGVLEVAVRERVPAVIWRTGDGLELLDEGGRRVKAITARTDRPDLPVILGEGADKAVGEALALLAAAGPLGSRIRGLVRVGERRWDLVLTDRQRVLLPEQGAVAALERLLALDAALQVFDRTITIVDLRNGRRPMVRIDDDGLSYAAGAARTGNRGDEI